MIRFCSILTVILTCQFLAGTANAEDEEFLSNEIHSKYAAGLVSILNKNFPSGRLSNGSHPAPITPEERRTGVIPFEAARRIIRLGADSALTQHCDQDWIALSFFPLMRRERDRRIWSDRQMTYIAMLHGMVQQHFLDLLESMENCSDTQKENVANFLSTKRW